MGPEKAPLPSPQRVPVRGSLPYPPTGKAASLSKLTSMIQMRAEPGGDTQARHSPPAHLHLHLSGLHLRLLWRLPNASQAWWALIPEVPVRAMHQPSWVVQEPCSPSFLPSGKAASALVLISQGVESGRKVVSVKPEAHSLHQSGTRPGSGWLCAAARRRRGDSGRAPAEQWCRASAPPAAARSQLC